ncbi:MAG: zinc ribbon domain-containing protein [Anaerolineae bacterium]|nr:zinc ribbon domain-containing protein [Anaerolineae bacterium]
MATCPNCGQPATGAEVFCRQCGQRLPPPAQRTCTTCGQSLAPNDRFCPTCGRPVAAATPPASAPPEPATWTPAPAALIEAKADTGSAPLQEDRRPGLGCYLGAAAAAIGSFAVLAALVVGLTALARGGVAGGPPPGPGFVRATSMPIPVAAAPTAAPALPDTVTDPPPTQDEAVETQPPPASPATLEPTGTPSLASDTSDAPPQGLTGDQYLDDVTMWDDFSSKAMGWAEGETENGGWHYIEDAYVIYDNVGMYIISGVPVDFAPTGINFDAALSPGLPDGEYGVICHYEDTGNFDAVALHPAEGSYQVTQLVDDEFINLTDPLWQPAPQFDTAIEAVNTIGVECLDDEIGLFINNEFVGRWTLTVPRAPSGMGLYVYSYYDGEEPYRVVFDNVQVWIPVQ